MITGIQNVHYYVQNMDRAVEYYSAAFGCKKVFGDEYWTSLSLHGITIGLHGNNGWPVEKVPRNEHGAKAGGTLTLKSDNIAEDRARLEKLGSTIIGEAKTDWGHMLVFEDLDGNILNLQHPSY